MLQLIKEHPILKEFSIKNYDACKYWGFDEWCIALSERRMNASFYVTEKNIHKSRNLNDFTFDRINKMANIDWEKKAAERRIKTPVGKPKSTSAPVPLSIKYIDFISGGIVQDLLNSYPPETAKEHSYNPYLLLEATAITPDTANRPEAFVAIDLSAHDKILVEYFSRWLSHTRTLTGIQPTGKYVEEKEFQTWIKQRLLPAIDLYYWLQLNEVKFTQEQVAELIFGDNPDINHMTQLRTAQKNALKLLDRKLLTALSDQAELFKKSLHAEVVEE